MPLILIFLNACLRGTEKPAESPEEPDVTGLTSDPDAVDETKNAKESQDGPTPVQEASTIEPVPPALEIDPATAAVPIPKLTFASSIQAEVFTKYCTRCHSLSGRKRPPLMDTYEDVFNSLDAIKEAAVDQTTFMPPKSATATAGLPEDVRMKLKEWIEAGAPKD